MPSHIQLPDVEFLTSLYVTKLSSSQQILCSRIQQLSVKDSYCIPLQDVADKKKDITDDDLLALITDEVNQPATLWSLLDLQVSVVNSHSNLV